MNCKISRLKRAFTLLFSISITLLYGQGITFKELSIEEAIQLANKEHKYIFIDIYTDWCGPCKWMDKNVFTDDSLAVIMQHKFICVKANAEKGIGIDYRKKFSIETYPTLLFLDATGNLMHKVLGKKTIQQLIEEVNKAINPKFQLSVNKAKFDAGERDSAFLYNYGLLLRGAGLDTREVSSAYLDKIGKEQWTSSDNFHYLIVTQKYYENPYFKYVAAHKAEFEGKVSDKHLSWYLTNVLSDAIYTVSAKQNKKLKRQLIADMKKLLPSEISQQTIDRFKNNYAFCDLKHTGNRIRGARKYYKKYVIPEEMNAVAWNIYKRNENFRMMKLALELVNKAIMQQKTNAYYLDTKARILYKLKKNEEALVCAKEAAEIAKAENLFFYDELVKWIAELESVK